MSPVIFMAAVAVSQSWGTKSCSPVRVAPPALPSYVQAAPSYVRTPEPYVRTPKPAPLVRRWVNEDGMRFEVYGIMDDNGKINWETDLDFNVRSYDAALAARRSRPAPRPAAPRPAAKPEIQNFGLAPDKMGLHNEEYTTGSEEARRFVSEAKGEAGDASKLHVTVIGTVDDCAPVMNDLRTHPALAGARERMLVQDYRPGEWPVNPALGFQNNGKPTILIQNARGPRDPRGGRVVYRAMDYTGGAEHLAEEIRKADPNYNPSLDPGPGKPGRHGCPLGFTSDHWAPILFVGIILGLVFLIKPKVKS